MFVFWLAVFHATGRLLAWVGWWAAWRHAGWGDTVFDAITQPRHAWGVALVA